MSVWQIITSKSYKIRVEHFPEKRYGQEDKNVLTEKSEAVEFTGQDRNAINVIWKELKSP
jgi:hypothetical protein